MFFKIKYPTDKQILFWNYNRDKYTGREIARKENVTPGFVSNTLKEADNRIKTLIEITAKSNKIALSLINEELGFAIGFSNVFNIKAHITFSPVNGVQVWYEHKGECASCSDLEHCRNTLIQEFKERGIKIDNSTCQPTDLCDILLSEIENRIEERKK